MRYRYGLMFAAVVAVVAAGLVVASQATTTTVRLRVIGPIGRTPPELAPADIKMTIDGQPRTAMSLDPAPATNVLLLIDVSTNLQQLIDVIPRAVVSAMQRPDSAHVAVFDGQLLFAPDPESDSAGFTAFLTKRLRQQRPTPLWDVARTAVLELVKQRKPAAIVLLSDGVNATGGAAAREAIDLALAQGIQIHAVRTISPVAADGGRSLRDVASATGGAYAEPSDLTRLADALVQVFFDIRSQVMVQVDTTGLRSKVYRLETAISRPTWRIRAPRSVLVTHAAR